MGTGGQRPGDGVRQPRPRLRHRGRLHPQPGHRRAGDLRRVPGQRPGRGRGGGHPHPAAGRGPTPTAPGGMARDFAAAFAAAAGGRGRAWRPTSSDMQDVEFTVQHGELYMLQTRAGKRTGPAAVRIAVDMVEEGVIERRRGAAARRARATSSRCSPRASTPPRSGAPRPTGGCSPRGCPPAPAPPAGASPSTPSAPPRWRSRGRCCWCARRPRPRTSSACTPRRGILTSRGGMTSHAAVVARGMGKPCIVGAEALHVDRRPARCGWGGRCSTRATSCRSTAPPAR